MQIPSGSVHGLKLKFVTQFPCLGNERTVSCGCLYVHIRALSKTIP
jgi:hypothetical protein